MRKVNGAIWIDIEHQKLYVIRRAAHSPFLPVQSPLDSSRNLFDLFNTVSLRMCRGGGRDVDRVQRNLAPQFLLEDLLIAMVISGAIREPLKPITTINNIDKVADEQERHSC